MGQYPKWFNLSWFSISQYVDPRKAPLDFWFFAHHKKNIKTEITQALQFASVEREVLLYQAELRYLNLQVHFPVLRYYLQEGIVD